MRIMFVIINGKNKQKTTTTKQATTHLHVFQSQGH